MLPEPPLSIQPLFRSQPLVPKLTGVRWYRFVLQARQQPKLRDWRAPAAGGGISLASGCLGLCARSQLAKAFDFAFWRAVGTAGREASLASVPPERLSFAAAGLGPARAERSATLTVVTVEVGTEGS